MSIQQMQFDKTQHINTSYFIICLNLNRSMSAGVLVHVATRHMRTAPGGYLGCAPRVWGRTTLGAPEWISGIPIRHYLTVWLMVLLILWYLSMEVIIFRCWLTCCYTLHLEPWHHKALPTRRKDLELCVSSRSNADMGKEGHVTCWKSWRIVG